MSEATGFETVDRKVAKNSFTPLQGWDDIRKVFELLRADENGALLVKGLADVTIGEISVDNVELIDSTGKEAASMPEGSILVQGDYLYYRDSSGTWKRAATYNATPS